MTTEDKSDIYKIDQTSGIWTKKDKLIIPGSDGTDRTDNNVPYGAGKTLRICESMVPMYKQFYIDNPDYYKDNNIQEIITMSNEEYMQMIRQQSENSPIDYSIVEGKSEPIQSAKEGGLVDKEAFPIEPELQNRKFNPDKLKEDLNATYLVDKFGNKYKKPK